jgi:dynein heavy chain
MPHKSFDARLIDEIFRKTQNLKQEFDDVERATSLINKREKLLGVTQTEFLDLKTIQDDLKPLYELWLVASNFGATMPTWIEDRFDAVDAGYVDLKTEEWLNELKRLQKTQLVAGNPRQAELQKFMMDSLFHFKKYGPMLRTMRTKGLAPRHWKSIGQKLGIAVDPAMATLYRLIMLELYEEEKMKMIKAVCEVATKEYAVQQALDGLEEEMKSAEFEFEYT